MVLRISNRDARRLLLDAVGLTPTPTGAPDVHRLISDLGYVQLDTIRVVARAHDHILWSRNQNYRETMLEQLLGTERRVFEHFTHDASVLPIETFPYWQRQFRRKKQHRFAAWKAVLPGRRARAEMKERIAREGPLSSNAFESGGKRNEMWGRAPHKLALDYMWYGGELATSHRENFKKFYDLSERVIPPEMREQAVNDRGQIDWLCNSGLDRLAFGSIGEITRFWDATSQAETKAWAARNTRDLVDVEIQCADGACYPALAPGDIEARLQAVRPATSRLRIINPFDPLVRDRTRLLRVFGLDYRIEIFVPAAKRQWGYYVFPMLEGERFVGRIEVRADRKADELQVLRVWQEPGVRWMPARWGRLDAELLRFARLAGVADVIWCKGARE